ncbi:hypothetical protein ABK040_015186 [Willaertia magna]
MKDLILQNNQNFGKPFSFIINKNLNKEQFSFDKRYQCIQGISEDKQDLTSSFSLSVYLSQPNTLHILKNNELKQIINLPQLPSFTNNSSNFKFIKSFHLYQRKQKKFTLLIIDSNLKLYQLDLFKKEKKRKDNNNQSTSNNNNVTTITIKKKNRSTSSTNLTTNNNGNINNNGNVNNNSENINLFKKEKIITGLTNIVTIKNQLFSTHGIILKEIDDNDLLFDFTKNLRDIDLQNIDCNITCIYSSFKNNKKILFPNEILFILSTNNYLIINQVIVKKKKKSCSIKEILKFQFSDLNNINYNTFTTNINFFYSLSTFINNENKEQDLPIKFQNQMNFFLDDQLIKYLFGTEVLLYLSSGFNLNIENITSNKKKEKNIGTIGMVGCKDGSIISFLTNHYQMIGQPQILIRLKEPIQNIIPFRIESNNNSKNVLDKLKCNAILFVGEKGYLYFIYLQKDGILQQHSYYLNKTITSSIIVKNQFLFTDTNGILYNNIEMREIPIYKGDIFSIHSTYFPSFVGTNRSNEYLTEVQTLNDSSISLSQFSGNLDESDIFGRSIVKQYGTCMIITKSGKLLKIKVPTHDLIDEHLGKSMRMKRIQLGIRDLIQQVDVIQNNIDQQEKEQQLLNFEIYSTNVAMHLLHEWQHQGNRLQCEMKAYTQRDQLESVVECNIYNGTEFHLFEQWSVIVIIEQDNSPIKSFSFSIKYLASKSTWNKIISLRDYFQKSLNPIKLTIYLTFTQREGQFSIPLHQQTFLFTDFMIRNLNEEEKNRNTLKQQIFKNLGMSSSSSSGNIIQTYQQNNTLSNDLLMNRVLDICQKANIGKTIPSNLQFPDLQQLSMNTNIIHTFKFRIQDDLFDNNSLDCWDKLFKFPIMSNNEDNVKSLMMNNNESLYKNNSNYNVSLLSQRGEELNMKITKISSSTTNNQQQYEFVLQGRNLPSLIAARHSILLKLSSYYQYLLSIDKEEAIMRHLPSKEELFSWIKSVQEIQNEILKLFNETKHLLINTKFKKEESNSTEEITIMMKEFSRIDQQIAYLYEETRKIKYIF